MRHQKIQQPQALPVHRSAAESVADHAPGNGATVSPPPLQFKTNNENEKKASPEAVTQQPDTLQEKELVKKKIQEGNIRVSSLTNIVFFERHPELNKRKLTRNA